MYFSLESAGFTNIRPEPLYDLPSGDVRRGKIESVVIEGKSDFARGDIFPKDTLIAITYHMEKSKNPAYQVKGAVVVHSVEEAVEESKKYEGDVFVIGGESIYRAMLDQCDTALVTKIDHAYDADTYFPNLDEDANWQMTKISEEQTCFDLEYYFTVYERIKK